MRQSSKLELLWNTAAALATVGQVQEVTLLPVTQQAVGNTGNSVSVSMNIYFSYLCFLLLCKFISGTKLYECKWVSLVTKKQFGLSVTDFNVHMCATFWKT